MIKPSISVLAAVEGTKVATPVLHAVVVPGAIVILVLLFLLQHRGAASIGRMFA